MISPTTVLDADFGPLPIRVVPIPDETLSSFTRRLAAANGIHPYDFDDLLRGERVFAGRIPKKQTPAGRVIALSGIAPETMRYAVLELCTPDEIATMRLTGRPTPLTARTRAACPRCCGTAGTSEHNWPQVWSRQEDQLICLRHRRLQGPEHRDLSGYPEILQANRRHRRLIRRFGRGTALRAITEATAIIQGFRDDVHGWGNDHYRRLYQRMRLFHGPRWSVDRADPTLLASQYPEVVELARMLASRFWQIQILRGHTYHPSWEHVSPSKRYFLAESTPGIDRFMSEARQVIDPAFSWEPWRKSNRLTRWVLDELDDIMAVQFPDEYVKPRGPAPWHGETYP